MQHFNQENGKKKSQNPAGGVSAVSEAVPDELVQAVEEMRREAAYSSGISVAPSSEAKKKAFQRAVSDLRANGYIETQNDLWWPKREAGQAGHCRDMSRYVPGQTGHTPIGVSRVPSDEVEI